MPHRYPDIEGAGSPRPRNVVLFVSCVVLLWCCSCRVVLFLCVFVCVTSLSLSLSSIYTYVYNIYTSYS